MADPVLVAERLPVTSEVAAHPLSTRTGIALLGHLISADVAWSGCTKPQQALLAELCPSVAEALLRDGAVVLEQMPLLPAGTRHGRLTGKAVHAWYYAVSFKETRAREPREADTAAGAPNQGGAG